MRNDSVRLTPLGEWVYVGVVSVLCRYGLRDIEGVRCSCK